MNLTSGKLIIIIMMPTLNLKKKLKSLPSMKGGDEKNPVFKTQKKLN